MFDDIKVEDFQVRMVAKAGEQDVGYGFHLSRGSVAAGLRKFADMLESDTSLTPQSVEINASAVFEDFASQKLVVSFARAVDLDISKVA